MTNIKAFESTAKKYGIDFALKKGSIDRHYLVFFKGRDADVLTAAFQGVFRRRSWTQEQKPSMPQADRFPEKKRRSGSDRTSGTR